MDDTLKSKILELLDQHRLMTVATNRPDGWPQATTVGYVNDGLTIDFLCSPQSQKAANLARDSRISLTIDHDVSDPMAITGLSMAALAHMLYTEPLLGLVVLFIAVPQVVAVPIIQRRINSLVRERVVTVRRAGDLVVANMQGGGGSSASSLGSEIGKAFEAIYRVRLRVFKLKFGLKVLVSGLQSGGVFRRDHGSQRENRNRHRGGLHQRA